MGARALFVRADCVVLWQIIEIYSVFAASLLQILDIKESFLTTAERNVVHGLFIFA